MSEMKSSPVRMLGLEVRRTVYRRRSAELRLRLALELSSPSIALETLEPYVHQDWFVVPSAVGLSVPMGISDAVASARAGHARWVELELAVHRDRHHVAALFDGDCDE